MKRHKPEQYLSFVLAGLLCPDLIFIEACLRCLRTVFVSPVTPVQLLYTVGCFVQFLLKNRKHLKHKYLMTHYANVKIKKCK